MKRPFQISTTIQIQQTFLKMFHTKQKYYKIFLDKSAKNVCSKNLKRFSLEKPNGFKKLTIFIFDLFFILLHFIFSRFQLLQSILCQWSRRLQLNSSKKACRISYWNFWSQKHLALDIGYFKTFLVPWYMLNGLKKKHFRLDQIKWIVCKLIIDCWIYMFNYITGKR